MPESASGAILVIIAITSASIILGIIGAIVLVARRLGDAGAAHALGHLLSCATRS